MPVYIGSRFSLRTGGHAGSPEVVQEALADLKISIKVWPILNEFQKFTIWSVFVKSRPRQIMVNVLYYCKTYPVRNHLI